MKDNPKNFPQPGHLLISEPFLQDENFVRSVILVCENNEDGAFGLVLNKVSILKLGELIEELEIFKNDVYVGGPVEQNTLHYIYHGEKVLDGSIELGKDLWWGGEFKQLVQKLKNAEINLNDIRFFIGYSGWSAGQLSNELDEQTWIICDKLHSESIFNASPDELWRIILKNMGGDYQFLANYPIDPRLN